MPNTRRQCWHRPRRSRRTATGSRAATPGSGRGRIGVEPRLRVTQPPGAKAEGSSSARRWALSKAMRSAWVFSRVPRIASRRSGGSDSGSKPRERRIVLARCQRKGASSGVRAQVLPDEEVRTRPDVGTSRVRCRQCRYVNASCKCSLGGSIHEGAGGGWWGEARAGASVALGRGLAPRRRRRRGSPKFTLFELEEAVEEKLIAEAIEERVA